MSDNSNVNDEDPNISTFNKPKKPTVVVVVGMAGVGKTTLVQRLYLHLKANQTIKGYFINLDPAMLSTPYPMNIDIRDTVNYKEVMRQYGLGPNGAILTSLNLFATRFDQVLDILERRSSEYDLIVVDTPGQIEAFTWSAGGQVILELLASSFATTLLYLTDSPRCSRPTTFMSNMLYSCSVFYKTKLPLVVTFNKIDVVSCEYALQWMTDYESYLQALDCDDEEYMGSLNRSLALTMEEFYRNIKCIGVSAATGQGFDDLLTKIEESAEVFRNEYLPELNRRMNEQAAKRLQVQNDDLSALEKDLSNTDS